MFAPYSFSALLHKRMLTDSVVSNILFTSTYKSWCLVNTHLNRDPAFSTYNTFWGNLCFSPGLENSHYNQWREQGIPSIKYIFDPVGTVRSFAQLQETHNLPNQDFFMFLQARHYAQSHSDYSPCVGSTDTLLHFMTLCKTAVFKIRFLYSHLVKPSLNRTWKMTLQGWSCDIPTVTSSELLLKGCEYSLKYTLSGPTRNPLKNGEQGLYLTIAKETHGPRGNGQMQKMWCN